MSMDDVMKTMDAFEQQLEQFNERLHKSMSVLKEHHEAALPLWQDNMQREYNTTWLPLEESIERYIGFVGPTYVDGLRTKLQHLRTYLYGTTR